jgi:putative ABC transport system ATP-binding protein
MGLLSVSSLVYRYPSGDELSFPDFSCQQGNNLLVLGRSGSGKTTLLHLMAGILSPQMGTITFNDLLFSSLTTVKKDAFRGKNIGMIFQKHFFIDGISVMDNLIAAQKLAGSPTDRSYLEELTRLLEISHLNNKKPSDLSEGEQQRFSIVRAIANKPSWILADEPTSGLDDDNCDNFIRLIKKASSGKTMSWIIATHDGRLKKHFENIYQL